jgi:tetrahydromethanopterin S-methyltransferase subunit G
MPVLPNPRHEAFAQAIFAGLSRHQNYSQAQAYRDAGYKVTNGNSARACASRLLTFANGVAERIHELQAEQLKRITPKLDLSKETIGRRLRMASEMAEQDRNPQAIVASELGIAKVFHRVDTSDDARIDFNTANSMQDIGRKLLQSVGFASPDDASVQEAIEANDVFIGKLVQIRDRAQTLTIE